MMVNDTQKLPEAICVWASLARIDWYFLHDDRVGMKHTFCRLPRSSLGNFVVRFGLDVLIIRQADYQVDRMFSVPMYQFDNIHLS